jgi:transposase
VRHRKLPNCAVLFLDDDIAIGGVVRGQLGWADCHDRDFRDAEAIAEAVQRPTMKFVATKTAEQLDLQALHRGRERLVGQRTGIINQIRAFLLERGIAVRQGLRFLRAELPTILATP